jgi:hypothetical protein
VAVANLIDLKEYTVTPHRYCSTQRGPLKASGVFRGKVRTPRFSALSPAAALGYPAGRVPPG